MRATATGLPLSIELDLGKFLAVLFNQRSELPQQFAAVGGRHFAPGTFIEGASGRLDGTVDILRVGFGDLRQDGPGRRIIIGECLARGGIDQLAINQEPIAPAHECLGWCAQAAVECSRICERIHVSSPVARNQRRARSRSAGADGTRNASQYQLIRLDLRQPMASALPVGERRFR